MMEGVIDDDTYFDCTGEFDLVNSADLLLEQAADMDLWRSDRSDRTVL